MPILTIPNGISNGNSNADANANANANAIANANANANAIANAVDRNKDKWTKWDALPVINMDGLEGSGLPQGPYVARYGGGDDYRAEVPLLNREVADR